MSTHFQVRPFKKKDINQEKSVVYQSFRIITWVYRLFGSSSLVGLKRSDSTKLRAKRCSFWLIYFSFLWFLCIVFVVAVSFLIINEMKVQTRAYSSFIQIFSLGLLALSGTFFCVMFWYKGPKIVVVLKQIIVLENDLTLSLKSKVRIKYFVGLFIFYAFVSLPAITFVIVYVKVKINFTFFFDSAHFTYLLCFTVTYLLNIWGGIFFIYSVYFALVFTSFFESINFQLREELNGREILEPHKLERFRKLHFKLTELVDVVDVVLSPCIFLFFLVGVQYCCICGALWYHGESFTEPYILLFTFFSLFFSMFTICMFSSGMTEKANHFYKIIEEIPVGLLPQRYIQQITNSALRAAENPIAFSASGFFTINQSLITTITGVILTYTVILIQTSNTVTVPSGTCSTSPSAPINSRQ
ncbi:uncharacterized protein LOC143228018 [Tachypleus tridentatus]|uniref:uncharacterized protein LOC143228018 n=1 Tax=Tachypleus tridentatus TaxID=6853 RepID=UPI003FCF70FE